MPETAVRRFLSFDLTKIGGCGIMVSNKTIKLGDILLRNAICTLPYVIDRRNTMVKHIILWKLDEKFSDSEKVEIKKNIKTHLEGLHGKISGLNEIKVVTDGLATSTADLMLDSTFDSAADLKNYSVNPLHVEVADTYVRPFTAQRSCLDFEV